MIALHAMARSSPLHIKLMSIREAESARSDYVSLTPPGIALECTLHAQVLLRARLLASPSNDQPRVPTTVAQSARGDYASIAGQETHHADAHAYANEREEQCENAAVSHVQCVRPKEHQRSGDA